MKVLKTIIFTLLIFSCSNKSRITEFENILGKENSDTLDWLVTDFETNYLQKKYSNSTLEKAYIKYLTEIESDSYGNWERPSNESVKKFNDSKLKELVYGIPDSIWVVPIPSNYRTEYRIRRKYLNLKGKYDTGTSEVSISKVHDEDSLIATLKNHYDINHFGRYREALRSVSKKEKFVEKYLEMTQAAGILDQRGIAYEMLISDLDFDNYFIKRLIITEIVHRL